MKATEKADDLLDLFTSPLEALKAVNIVLQELDNNFQGFASTDRFLFWVSVGKEIANRILEDEK